MRVVLSALTEKTLLSSPSLQRREGQVKMARAVAELLSTYPEKAAAVEAGTGTGKSLAYLVPVMLQCVKSSKRTIIATGTKNLQDQLAKKDAPFAAELTAPFLPRPASFAVMYGKGNYVCLALLERRLKDFEKTPLATGDEAAELSFLLHIKEWLSNGGSGFYEETPAWAGPAHLQVRFWAEVSAASDDADCTGCGLTGSCPFQQARERVRTADVVITNHHLVVANYLLQTRSGVDLFGDPPPEVLVVDEAHDFPDAALGCLECGFTLRRVERLYSDIFRYMEKLAEFAAGRNSSLAKVVAEAKDKAKEIVGAQFESVKDKIATLFDGVKAPDPRPLFPGQEPAGAADLLKEMNVLFSILLGYASSALESAGEAGGEEEDRQALRLYRRYDRLRERAHELDEAFRRAVLLERHYRLLGEKGDVCWVEHGRFAARPVRAAELLRGLWSKYGKIVFTSATLFPFPQSEGFKWFAETFAISADEVLMGVLPSPFRYEEQMQVVVATDEELSVNKKSEATEPRAKRLAEIVAFIASRARGGVLVLFTSRKEMLRVAELVEPLLPTDRPLLVQGVHGGKAELLSRCREHGKAVLFGVDSFWQGVDLPGDLVTTVIISRIPFPCPDDPDIEAEVWLAGEDWWKKVYRLRTVLTLRQGVGRLIRTEADSGVLLVADPRAAGRHRRLVERAVPVAPVSISFKKLLEEAMRSGAATGSRAEASTVS